MSPIQRAGTPTDLTKSTAVDLWRAALEVVCLDPHSTAAPGRCQRGLEAPFVALELNVGAYQNLPHLHLKAWVGAAQHEEKWRANRTYITLRSFSYHLPPVSGV